jgi:hypothetical protein
MLKAIGGVDEKDWKDRLVEIYSNVIDRVFVGDNMLKTTLKNLNPYSYYGDVFDDGMNWVSTGQGDLEKKLTPIDPEQIKKALLDSLSPALKKEIDSLKAQIKQDSALSPIIVSDTISL